jgi:hypothetical protein
MSHKTNSIKHHQATGAEKFKLKKHLNKKSIPNDNHENYSEGINNFFEKGCSKVKREIFCMPETEFYLLDRCKKRGLNVQNALNKSEIIRAGILLLSQLPENEFIKAISREKKIKTGRPKL